MTTSTVIQCLDKLFTLCGTPGFIHSDNGSCVVSAEFKQYLMDRRIASSRSSIYLPAGNGQAEKTVGTIWKTVQLALKTQDLSVSQWEIVLDDALHCIRSLVCTATNAVPHERFFCFQPRSCSGVTLPSWMTVPGKVFLRRFVRNNKNEPLSDEVELVNVNPTYANVRFPNGREVTVSLRDIAPCPQSEHAENVEVDCHPRNSSVNIGNAAEPLPADHLVDKDVDNNGTSNSPQPLRRSARSNKGVPPLRFGDGV